MINSLNELSDIYLGNISEADNSPEAVKARVMQYVRAIRYRSRKEGETLNKAYNEFMGSQSGVSSTEKQMVKERLGLTGGSAHVGEGYQRDPEQSKKDRTRSKQPDPSKDGFTGIGNLSIKDIQKMNARMKKEEVEDVQEADIADILARLEKKRISKGGDPEESPLPAMRKYHADKKKKVKKEGHVSWRDELREINDADPVTEKDAEKKIKEKKINNKITINPNQGQAESFAKALGGEVLELYEVAAVDSPEDEAAQDEDPKAKSQADREKRMKVRLLRLKMMSAKQGVAGIVAHHEPEGDVISEKEVKVKDTRRVVDAIRAYDRSKDASDEAIYDTEHGRKDKGDAEKKYAKKERGEIEKDDPKWKKRKYHTGMHGESLEIQDANGNVAYHIVDVIKAPTGLKAAEPIPALAELSEETIRESIDEATLHFFHEGINEDGLDLIIEEVGLEDFTDYVLCGPDILEEERAAKRANVRNLQAVRKKVKTDAEAEAKRKEQKKGEYKPAPKKKPRLGAPTYTTTVSKVKKATAAAKQKQSDKKPNRVGLLGKIRGAVKKVGDSSFGQGVKAVGKFAKDVDSVLKVNKKTTVNMQSYEPEGEVISEKKKKQPSVHDDYYDPMEDPTFDPHEAEATRGQSGRGTSGKMNVRKKYPVKEANLSAAERRALPDKEFALPGKGKGPEGKQAGSYPIPDEKHARSALSLVAQHGTPAEKATVRAKVKKKFPDIQQEGVDSATPRTAEEKKKMAKMKALLDRMQQLKVDSAKKARGDVTEGDAAFDSVVSRLRAKHGKDAVITKDSPKPKPPSEAEKKKAAAELKKRQDADNKAYAARAKKAGFKSTQDYTNVVARYGSEDNYNKGKGLGT